jgi:alkyl sulfatase BDS1-like metallo-beta-lactamase superfamily hydrolase
LAFVINLITPDNGGKFIVEMSHSTLITSKRFRSDQVDLTVATFAGLAAEGQASLQGDGAILERLNSVLMEFTSDFEILPGTKPATGDGSAERDLFEQPEPASSAGD